MPTYTIATPRGQNVTIQADDPDTALSGAQKWDLEDHASSEAQRLGVDPSLALRVMDQESRGNPDAVSPRGARGPMQLMPDTAKELGVDPTDPYQNITGGITYLKQQMDAFKDPRLALAAYNAGPGAVQKYGGVPPFKETQAYVRAIMGDAAPAQPQAPARMPVQAPQMPAGGVQRPVAAQVAAKPAPGIMDDLKATLLGHPIKAAAAQLDAIAPFIPGLNVIERMSQGGGPLVNPAHPSGTLFQKMAGALLPQSQYQPQTLPGQVARTIIDFAPAAAAPGSIPQRAANVLGPALGSEAAGQVAHRMGAPAVVEQIARAAGGLGGGLLASTRVTSPAQAAAPKSLEEMQAASDAAWKAVDNSPYRFPVSEAKATASDIKQAFEDAGGADLYPRSAPLVKRIDNLAENPDGLSVAQVNRLRSQIGTKLLQPGSDEADMGALLKDKLEGLIQTSNDPSLSQARDLYTRLVKMREVTQRAESAALKTPQNGSAVTPNRSAMRPLVDPTSPQRIKNLTPDETAALKQLANGTAGQNIASAAGRFLDPRSLLGSTTNGLLGLATGGHAPLVTAPLGMLATAASNKGVRNSLQNLLDLISTGGVKPEGTAVTVADTNPALFGLALGTLAPSAAAASTRPSPRPKSRSSASR